ncbi:MAG: glycosyl transferase family 1, partial [Ferruginibacter sp.]
MKVLLFHLTGNANVKAALNGFADAGILHKFYVCIAAIPGTILHKIGTINVFSEIRRRSFNTRLRPFLRTWPWLEIGRLVANKSRLKIFSKQRQGLFHVDSVVQNLDKHVAKSLKSASKKGLHAVYGYEDTTIHSFREAKRIGLQCLYDLPIGYWRTAHRLLQAERHRWPEWAPTMGGLNDWEEKLLRKEEELQMADKIFVASTFTANSLKEFPGKLAPVYVIPYGFPPVSNENRQYESFKNGR